MRLLHIVFAVFLVAGVGGWSQAQTPTPAALDAGLYQFEDLISPEIELSGDWVISDNIAGVSIPRLFLSSITGTSSLVFNIVNGSYFTIDQGVWSNGLDAFTVQVDDTIYSISNDYPSVTVETIPFPLSSVSGVNTVTISRDGDSMIYLDYLTVHPAIVPEETPEAYYILSTISGTEIETRFDMVVTAGDVAITSALIFLFFSMVSIFMIILFVSGRDV